ncbi:hypothetical protein BDZ45DRAFT_752878 [Acephala macrosclerotiorum]|nr:hypothetical protein BDZ45DRAFT_752878 [Acephala macrosclerotiorum]
MRTNSGRALRTKLAWWRWTTDGRRTWISLQLFRILTTPSSTSTKNRLLSEIPLEAWSWNDIHTIYCIDHIHEDLMCNPDLSLRGSMNYVSLDTTSSAGPQCRDLDAVERWALEHSTEKDVRRPKVELEREYGREIPYDQLKVDHDPETGVVTVQYRQSSSMDMESH